MHYQRNRLHGSLEAPPPRPKRQYPACESRDCEMPGNRKGLCEAHYKREWHEANGARSYAAHKARRATDRSAYLAKSRAYYEANRERILARMAEAYAADPEAGVAKVRAWREANPIKRREQSMRRNARKRETQVEPIDYVAILDEHGMFCHICWLVIVDESDLHFDHVIPLALGGPHTRDNIKPSHARCNIRKGARAG